MPVPPKNNVSDRDNEYKHAVDSSTLQYDDSENMSILDHDDLYTHSLEEFLNIDNMHMALNDDCDLSVHAEQNDNDDLAAILESMSDNLSEYHTEQNNDDISALFESIFDDTIDTQLLTDTHIHIQDDCVLAHTQNTPSTQSPREKHDTSSIEDTQEDIWRGLFDISSHKQNAHISTHNVPLGTYEHMPQNTQLNRTHTNTSLSAQNDHKISEHTADSAHSLSGPQSTLSMFSDTYTMSLNHTGDNICTVNNEHNNRNAPHTLTLRSENINTHTQQHNDNTYTKKRSYTQALCTVDTDLGVQYVLDSDALIQASQRTYISKSKKRKVCLSRTRIELYSTVEAKRQSLRCVNVYAGSYVPYEQTNTSSAHTEQSITYSHSNNSCPEHYDAQHTTTSVAHNMNINENQHADSVTSMLERQAEALKHKMTMLTIMHTCRLLHDVQPEAQDIDILRVMLHGNIRLQTMRYFCRYFPYMDIHCDYEDEQKCDACNIAHSCQQQINGETIIQQLNTHSIRMHYLCRKTATCMLFINNFFTHRHTIAHDGYMRNVRYYILSTIHFNKLLNTFRSSIHDLYVKCPTAIHDDSDVKRVQHENALTINMHMRELKQMFTHKFATYIFQKCVESCAKKANIQYTQARKVFNLHNVKWQTFYDENAASTITRDMFEHADRIQRIKQHITQSAETHKSLQKPPFLSCLFLFFNLSEIFDILLNNRQLILSADLPNFIRKILTFAPCVCEPRFIPEVCKLSDDCNLMLSLDLFHHSFSDIATESQYLSQDEVMIEVKVYVRKILHIFRKADDNTNICLAHRCIEHIDYFISTGRSTREKSTRKYLHKQIFDILTQMDHALQKSYAFTGVQTPKRNSGAYTSSSYESFSFDDICNQAVMTYTLDVSMTHTFHIMNSLFTQARNIMLNVILNIWRIGHGTKDRFDEVMTQYDEELMSRFYTVLQEIQVNKANNLHVVLPYELAYNAQHNHSDCVACNIFNSGHYSNKDQYDVCVPLLCLRASLSALLCMLPSAITLVSIPEILSHKHIDAAFIARAITIKLMLSTLKHNVTTKFLLNEKLCNILNMPHCKYISVQMSLV